MGYAFFDLLWGARGLLSRRPARAPSVPLRLYNTLSQEVEPFISLGGTVKMYNCGPTVYAAQTIGNLRGPLLANLLRRTFLTWGHYVRHVSNITDVGHLVSDSDEGEDKIEVQAKKEGLKAQDIAQHYTQLFFDDLDALGIERSKIVWAPATKYIAEQIALVHTLEEKGYTYTIRDGVYFNTAKFPAYGRLGNINLEGQQAGARVEENKEKKNPHDFALWKFSQKYKEGGEKRQQQWRSPWGIGFPGWHLECTAIIFTLLGKQIDVHMGGEDLIPIHHNNEIAQAEAATGKQFVKYWMHNAFITIEGKKISKSLGNTVYLHNITDRGLSAQSLRYWYLTAHYRTPMNFTWDAIAGADQALKRLNRSYLELSDTKALPRASAAAQTRGDGGFLRDFYEAIANDLDTPRALARMWELVRDPEIAPGIKRASLAEADALLGLGFSKRRPAAKLKVIEESGMPQEVQELMRQRDEARAAKNFTSADLLREKIEALGYELKDTPEGSEISKK